MALMAQVSKSDLNSGLEAFTVVKSVGDGPDVDRLNGILRTRLRQSMVEYIIHPALAHWNGRFWNTIIDITASRLHSHR